MNEKINKRINLNLSIIKQYNDQLQKENKSEREFELIQKSITLIEREQSFLTDLLLQEQVKQLNKQRANNEH
tara:strand:- start:37 stop:252 length:216 start_codon:yes stop_codon:yes gene_type:complete